MKKLNKNTKFRLRSQLDADIYAGQVFTEPSICEPNQSLTAQEILNNFRLSGRTGLFDSVPGALYDEDGDIEDMANLDKTELEDVRRSVSERRIQYEERLQALSQVQSQAQSQVQSQEHAQAQSQEHAQAQSQEHAQALKEDAKT